ncbi:MAG: nuclear transport factor 2 family protein [Burkholderiaceae bacterium]|nr:nuclear transport factor 2 family protein [Burkholderiaceae bacterium]
MDTHNPLRQPLDTVRAIYAAFGRGDLLGLLAQLHPQIDWGVSVAAPGAEQVPMLRHGVGHEAVQRYFAGVARLEFLRFEVGRFLADQEVVVTEIEFEARHRGNGRSISSAELHHWTVDRGLAIRFRPYVDTAALIELYRP